MFFSVRPLSFFFEERACSLSFLFPSAVSVPSLLLLSFPVNNGRSVCDAAGWRGELASWLVGWRRESATRSIGEKERERPRRRFASSRPDLDWRHGRDGVLPVILCPFLLLETNKNIMLFRFSFKIIPKKRKKRALRATQRTIKECCGGGRPDARVTPSHPFFSFSSTFLSPTLPLFQTAPPFQARL